MRIGMSLILVGSISCVATADDHGAGPSGGMEVLQSLAQYDSIFMSGCTASGVASRSDRIDTLGPFFRVDARWRMTGEGDRLAYSVEASEFETPKYLPPDERRWATGRFHNPAALDEPMFANVRTKEWGYWGQEASGVHQVDLTLKIGPDSSRIEVGTVYNSMLFTPTDLSLIATPRVFQWGLGRFFAARLQRVTEVMQTGDGRVRVSAHGELYKGANGRWELEIEPAAAWMVRRAKFFPDTDPTQVDAEMMNEGTVWSGSFCIPKSARVNFFGPLEDMKSVPKTTTHELTFDPVIEKFDEHLYHDSHQAVLHSKQPHLTVTDARMSPPVITQPNRPQLLKGSPSEPSPFRGWFVVMNLIALAVVGFFLFKRSNKTIPGKD